MGNDIWQLFLSQAKIYFSFIDFLFPVCIIIVIQMMKRLIKIPVKWWSLVMLTLGFGVALIKVTPFDISQFLIQGFIYSALCEVGYQCYKKISIEWKSYRIFKKGEK